MILKGSKAKRKRLPGVMDRLSRRISIMEEREMIMTMMSRDDVEISPRHESRRRYDRWSPFSSNGCLILNFLFLSL